MQFKSNPNYDQALLSTLVHIQTHLHADMSLEFLANRAGFSAYHFHRIFREFVGEPVKEYIRRLRLERGAYRLKISEDSVLQIALECGFKTHESFTRAFTRRFGVPPSAFRKDFLAKNQKRTRRADVRSGANELDRLVNQSAEVQVRIERVKPILVAFVRHIGPYDSVLEPGSPLASVWEALFQWGNHHSLTGPDSLMIGIGQDDPSVTPPEKLRFDVCVQVPVFRNPTGSIGCQTISPGAYAVGRHYGSFDNLADTYGHIYMNWLPTSKYRMRAIPAFEVYGSTWVNDDLQIHYTDVYMPIESINGRQEE